MNKIFKTVHNRTTGATSAVSELAKGNGKAGKCKLLALATILGLGSANLAYADTQFIYTGDTTLSSSSLLDSMHDLIPVAQGQTSAGTVYTYYVNQNNQVMVDYSASYSPITGVTSAYINPNMAYGGYSTDVNSLTNATSVSVLHGNVESLIYGGYASGAQSANAANTSVIMANDATLISSGGGMGLVSGAVAESTATFSGVANASQGSILLTDSVNVQASLFGVQASASGFSGSATATDGAVTVTNNATVGTQTDSVILVGAVADAMDYASATQGSVVLTNNSQVWGSIYAGEAAANDYANASYNSVVVSGQAMLQSGTNPLTGMAFSDGAIYGGFVYGDIAKAEYNHIIITDNALIEGDVFGGYVMTNDHGEVSYNTITVSGNATLNGWYDVSAPFSAIYGGSIIGGYTDGLTGYARYNTINLAGNITLQQTEHLASGNVVHHASSLLGGTHSYTGSSSPLALDVFTGNTLNFSANPIIVAKLGNFAHYNFSLNDFNKEAIDKGQALITVTDEIRNDDSITQQTTTSGTTVSVVTPNQSQVQVTGISGTHIIQSGQSVTLIEASQTDAAGSLVAANIIGGVQPATGAPLFSGLFAQDASGNIASNVAQVGLVKEADISYTIDDVTQSVTAQMILIKRLLIRGRH